MSVRQSLLAILDQGPCYGYQLRAEFDRRTGSIWPLNVGQIYNTLERLERDGLVARGDADDQGHVYWAITSAGSAEVSDWLSSPVTRAATQRDELAIKLAVAATLPGVDAVGVVRAQLAESRAHLRQAQAARNSEDAAEDAETFAASLLADAEVVRAEAEVRWLEHLEQRLLLHPGHALALSLSTNRPKRGRPRAAIA